MKKTLKKKYVPKHYTKGRLKSLLKTAWLRSPERREALKATGYRCTNCGIKQSVAKGRVVKIQVHHMNPVMDEKEWMEQVWQLVKKHLFVPTEQLEPLCVECHKAHHDMKKLD